MSNPNKAKGNSFERQLAEHLTKIFGLNFRRVPNSGAMTGGYNARVTSTLTSAQQLLLVGDLIPPEELGKFSWECKFYKDLPFHTLLSENAMLDKWILQAQCPDRFWFLCFKLNNKGAFVVWDAQTPIQFVFGGNYIWYKGCYVVPMDHFFETNKDEMLKWGDSRNGGYRPPITVSIDGSNQTLPGKLVIPDGSKNPQIEIDTGPTDGGSN